MSNARLMTIAKAFLALYMTLQLMLSTVVWKHEKEYYADENVFNSIEIVSGKKINQSRLRSKQYALDKRNPHVRMNTSFISEVKRDRKTSYHYDTAVIITTHLIPSHPSLEIFNETLQSLKFLKGLPSNSQIIVTVDGLNEDTPENRQTYHLLKSESNEKRLQIYINTLKMAYRNHENINILVSKAHQHLGWTLKNALDYVDKKTKYLYILQQDLPFIRDINHTAIVKTVQDYPDIVNLIRFNNRINRVQRHDCWNQTEPVQNINGISLHKTPTWSDMDYFTPVPFFRDHILSSVDLNDFPERSMMKIAWKNCSFYGPHLYGNPLEEAYVKHTDGAERYGKKLKARIAKGDVKKEDLKASTIREEKIEI